MLIVWVGAESWPPSSRHKPRGLRQALGADEDGWRVGRATSRARRTAASQDQVVGVDVDAGARTQPGGLNHVGGAVPQRRCSNLAFTPAVPAPTFSPSTLPLRCCRPPFAIDLVMRCCPPPLIGLLLGTTPLSRLSFTRRQAGVKVTVI